MDNFNKEKRKAYCDKYNKEHQEEHKAYYKEHQEEKKEYQKKYRKEHQEQINEKFICECGGKYTHKHISKHIKTKKHQNYINK